MTTRRASPQSVKLHRSYSVPELAACVGVHKNTVRHWQRDGLAPIDKGRPVLFQGASVRAFLAKRSASRKQPCPPGTLYCFRCRLPRPPALGMVDCIAATGVSGNFRAICETYDTIMHRRRPPDVAGVDPARTRRPISGCPATPNGQSPALPEL